MSDVTPEKLIGASVSEQELFEYLTSHVRGELSLLREYESAAKTTSSKALAYLVKLLIEDEQRHHRLFEDIALSLKNEAELNESDPPIPRIDFEESERPALLEVTERLLRREEEDAIELKRLQRLMHNLAETTLWPLLVELMQRDTEKHIAIVRFARHQAKRLPA